jgi:hypothetical protein
MGLLAKKKRRTKLSQELARETPPDVNDCEVSSLRKQITQLEKVVHQQQALLEKQKSARGKFKKGVARNPRGSFIRVLVADTHGFSSNDAAVSAVINDIKSLDVRELIFLGDHLNCDGFLAQHHVLGFVAQTDYTFEQDVSKTNDFLDVMQEACPKAKAWYIEGNHEVRIERWAVNQALRGKVDAEYLLKVFGPKHILGLEKRGIPYVHTLDTSFNSGKSRGVLELGKCLFLHGFAHSKHAVSQTLDKLGHNFVMGHIHRQQSASKTLHRGEISGWCAGCLCELRQYYNHTRPTDHTHGYAIQVVEKDGTFLHVNIPIIEGRSLLRNLFKSGV